MVPNPMDFAHWGEVKSARSAIFHFCLRTECTPGYLSLPRILQKFVLAVAVWGCALIELGFVFCSCHSHDRSHTLEHGTCRMGQLPPGVGPISKPAHRFSRCERTVNAQLRKYLVTPPISSQICH